MPTNDMQSHLCHADAWLLDMARIQILHEATLQDLLQTRNDAVSHILHERNELLCERLSCESFQLSMVLTPTNFILLSSDFPSEALRVNSLRLTF